VGRRFARRPIAPLTLIRLSAAR